MLMKVLITEDHELYRDGLRLMVNSLSHDIEVLEAVDFPSALEQLNTHLDLDFLLLDIKIPGTQGLDGLRAIRNQFPTLVIIVVSTLDFDQSVGQIMKLGANGFIAKNTPKNDMIDAIRKVLAGDQVIISEHDLQNQIELSPRQNETLTLLAQGLSNKEIARSLGVSDTTVREYVSFIIKQLQVENRTQAVLSAKKRGFLLDD